LRTLTAVLFLEIAALSLTGCGQGDKRITLTFKFQPGMRLEYEQVSRQNTRIMVGDSITQEIQNTFKSSISYEVVKVKDSIAQIKEHTTRHLPGAAKSNPSDSNPDKINNSNKVSRVLSLKIKPNGKVVEVLPSVKGDNERTVSYLKNYYEQGVPVFPSEEVYPGYTWTQSTRVILPEETMEASTTYRIKSLAREAGYDCALIEYEGDLLIPLSTEAIDSTGYSGTDRIHATGIIYFAYREGVVVLQRERWVIDGERHKINDNTAEPVHILSEIDTDFTLMNRRID
jgi:hypothetical protein